MRSFSSNRGLLGDGFLLLILLEVCSWKGPLRGYSLPSLTTFRLGSQPIGRPPSSVFLKGDPKLLSLTHPGTVRISLRSMTHSSAFLPKGRSPPRGAASFVNGGFRESLRSSLNRTITNKGSPRPPARDLPTVGHSVLTYGQDRG